MFGFFKAKPTAKPPATVMPDIDLKRFSCDGVELGGPVPEDAFFAADVRPDGVYLNESSGLEFNVDGKIFDSIHIRLDAFKGRLFAGGEELGFSPSTTEAEVEKVFGVPYHRDVDESGEVLLLHEYRGGEIELQFEFPSGKGLQFITICRFGVLSRAEQREAYGVTSPWPPHDR